MVLVSVVMNEGFGGSWGESVLQFVVQMLVGCSFLSSRVSILLELSRLEALRGRQEKVVLRGLKQMFLLSPRRCLLPGMCPLCINLPPTLFLPMLIGYFLLKCSWFIGASLVGSVMRNRQLIQETWV